MHYHKVLAGDYDSYKYLVESIRKFPTQEDFAAMIRFTGFDMVCYENLSCGICAIHKGTKPLRTAKQMPYFMAAAPPIRILFAIPRRMLSLTSNRNVRFRSSNPGHTIKAIGRLVDPIESDTLYDPGQLFIHKTFAYKGVVVCAFKCRFQEKKSNSSDRSISQGRYYQVLIDRGDWGHMGFPVDLTSYLMDGTTRGEKLLTLINGMDCVSHYDILPFATSERDPLDHDLFHRIFDVTEEGKEFKITMKANLFENYMASQRS
ncbi:unnamed protein product, partial [Strongylus vulgaris]